MYSTLPVLLLIVSNLIVSHIDRAFTFVQNGNWTEAAAALDLAVAEDPTAFAANNLHYLRGRIAESQGDWTRALSEFEKIPKGNSLRQLAVWHAMRALNHLGQVGHAERAAGLLVELPAAFPVELKTQLARESQTAFALKVYDSLTTRDARFQRASLRNQYAPLWVLIRELNTDDVALQAARKLAPRASTSRELMDIADTMTAHRQFDEAISFYERAARTTASAPRARFHIARALFLKQDYPAAIQAYQRVIQSFPGTDWQKDSDLQIANTYWRLRQYPEAEKAYVNYINRYSAQAFPEGAVRDLVDVYRAQEKFTEALSRIETALARRLTTATRQVLLFTKAKILYAQERYDAALDIFRQLGRQRLIGVAGGTTTEEVRFFEAMTLSELGNETAAAPILIALAAEPFTYYGQKAAEYLDRDSDVRSRLDVCSEIVDPALITAAERLRAMRRPLRSEANPAADAVGELIFLQLWDEAAIWIERTRQSDARIAADLAYAASRYHRAISHGDRLPKTEPSTLALVYPAGFRELICAEASKYGIDPLWLHAIIWQESKYNPRAQSAAAARGLMQFIPETARSVGSEIGMPDLALDSLYDPVTNIRLGARYWATLMDELDRPELALAAYNGGIDNVRRWRDKWPEADIDLFVSEIGFVETKRYVQAVFGARAAYGRGAGGRMD